MKEYPTEASALKVAEALRMTINAEQPQSFRQPVSVSALIDHFQKHELGIDEEEHDEEEEDDDEGRAYSTRTMRFLFSIVDSP